MQLHLRIAVYKGGDYWRECWKSVKDNLDLFDGMFVSFNLYEGQEDDIAVMHDVASDKLHWRKQDKFLSAEAHGRVIDAWLRQFNLKGHIFILCHDDMLVRKGLLELRELNLKDNDAVFCGAEIFNEDDKLKSIIIHELSSNPRICMPPDVFIATWNCKSLNVSRSVIPAILFNQKTMPCHCLKYGCYAELLYLCTPFTKRIYQTYSPAVKIRRHSASETSRTPPSMYTFDYLLFCTYMFSVFPYSDVRFKMASDIGFLLKRHPLCHMFYLLQAQFRLMHVKHYNSWTGLLILGYFLMIFWNKITSKLNCAKRRII